MQTDSDIVKLCAGIYDPSFTGWGHFFDGSEYGICAGIKDNTLIFRGSITATDWLRDLEAFPSESKIHPQLGEVHSGFDEYMDEFTAKAFQLLDDGACFGGHSLGAARAWLAAGRYIAQGGRPGRIGVFGAPKPGCAALGQLLAPYPKASFRNGLDPVTEVPFWIGTDVAIEPTPLKCLQIEPTDWSEGLMAWHNINLYEKGVTCLST